MKKEKIYIDNWLIFKPYEAESNTDLYYLRVANHVHENISSNDYLILSQYLDTEEIKQFCCYIVSYFEDIISDTNVWKSFKIIYRNLYDDDLPFFNNLTDYYEEEINIEDLEILIWYFINTKNDDVFVNPRNTFINNIGLAIMNVLDEHYEFAPKNTKLKKYYTLDAKSDFYEARQFIQMILFSSYLFYNDVLLSHLQEVIPIMESDDNIQIKTTYVRELREIYTFNRKTALLSKTGSEWCAAILGQSHPLYHSVKNISQRLYGQFLVEKQNEKFVFIEHIASGMPFEMTKKSFDHSDELQENDIIYIGLVKWENEWWFSGTYIKSDFDADTILDLKNSREARAEVNFLEDQANVADALKKQETGFKNFNNGSLIAFKPGNEMDLFIQNYFESYNAYLSNSKNEIDEAVQRARDEGYFHNNTSSLGLNDDAFKDDFVVFLNPKSGLEFYPNIAVLFPDEKNPFFKEVSTEEFGQLLFSPSYSTQLVTYYLEKYRDHIPFISKFPYNLYMENLDFLLRFWKKGNYESVSSIIFTGKQSKY